MIYPTSLMMVLTVNAEGVMNILQESNQKEGTTIIMVTHDPDFAKMAKRQIRMADGRVIDDGLKS